MSRSVWLAALVLLGMVLSGNPPGRAAITERVSVSSTGEEANLFSYVLPTTGVSADGRFVVFASRASNLAGSDINRRDDIFLRDRVEGETIRISVASDGTGADYESWSPSISHDGRYIAFGSLATNLIPSDGLCARYIVYDRTTGEMEPIAFGTSDLAISGDGRYVAFAGQMPTGDAADYSPWPHVFVYDRWSHDLERVSISSSGEPANGRCEEVAISTDGRFVVFVSEATNLVEDDTNGCRDVFIRDRLAGVTERVSVNDSGDEANNYSVMPSVSADGRFVAFGSAATNLGPGSGGWGDVFVRDRATGTTELVSVNSAGEPADRGASWLCMSADGRYVVFDSMSMNLAPDVPSDTWQLYLHDRVAGKTQCISRNNRGEPAAPLPSGDSVFFIATISPNGRYIVYASRATNLVPDDTNGWQDVFIRDRLTFSDVPLDHWAFYEVEGCVNGKVVTGYPDGLYHPDESVTRAQMAVYAARGLAGGDENVPPGPLFPAFFDVLPIHWAYKYVEYCYDQGIVEGYWDGYHPNETVDRAQMAVFVARAIASPPGEEGLAGYTPPETPTFPDVPADHWAYKYVEYCHAQGIVQGYGDGYHPDETVTRAQMAVYITRAFDLPM